MSEDLRTTITMNGTQHALTSPTIAAALAALRLNAQSAHVAVALNDVVVRRSQWESCTLKNGDRMEVITAVAGG